jgi:hypothetical protein
MPCTPPAVRRPARLAATSLLAAACLALGPTGPATGQATQPAEPSAPAAPSAPASEAKSMGVLAPFLLYGEDPQGPWIGQTDGNGYRLINPQDAGAVTYFYVNRPAEDDGPRSVSVQTVIMQGDGAAGLLSGYRDDPRTYLLYTLDGQGRIEVRQRMPEGGFQSLFNAQLEAPDGEAQGPRLVTLRLTDEPDGVGVYFNDGKLHTLDDPSLLGGGVGVAAAGRVDALLLDFAIDPAGP